MPMLSTLEAMCWFAHFICAVTLRLLCDQEQAQDLVMPAHKAEPGDEYEGATVIEPKQGWVFLSGVFFSVKEVLYDVNQKLSM